MSLLQFLKVICGSFWWYLWDYESGPTAVCCLLRLCLGDESCKEFVFGEGGQSQSVEVGRNRVED